jgi:hypothetical protein
MPEQSAGFGVGELDTVVRALAGGANELNGMASGAPEPPDAGESTADIAGALTAIFASASTIVRSVAAAGDRVLASAASYHDNDLNSAGRLGGWPR